MTQPSFVRRLTSSHLLLALAGLAGCTEAHVASPDAGVSEPDAAVVLADAPRTDAPAPEALLATCLSEGRGLVEIATVDNNDTADHGALLRFGLSPAGLIAAAGGDGTLKLWTLDAELLGTFDGSILTYGPEIPAAPITDIAFDGESILVGDVRGIVLQMEPGGGLFPIGGTTPEIAIRAVAFDAAHRTLAHAQSGDVAPLLIRADEATVELETELLVDDLMFAANGDLWVAGSSSGYLAIERRAAPSFDTVSESIAPAGPGAFVEMASLATGPEHGRFAAVSEGSTLLGSGTLVSGGGVSVALATDGTSTVALIAGPDGLSARDALDGAGTPIAVGSLALDGAVTVRVDEGGALAVVGTSDAHLHVLACAP